MGLLAWFRRMRPPLLIGYTKLTHAQYHRLTPDEKRGIRYRLGGNDKRGRPVYWVRPIKEGVTISSQFVEKHVTITKILTSDNMLFLDE